MGYSNALFTNSLCCWNQRFELWNLLTELVSIELLIDFECHLDYHIMLIIVSHAH